MDKNELKEIKDKISQFGIIDHKITCCFDKIQKELWLINTYKGRLCELLFDLNNILESEEDETLF